MEEEQAYAEYEQAQAEGEAARMEEAQGAEAAAMDEEYDREEAAAVAQREVEEGMVDAMLAAHRVHNKKVAAAERSNPVRFEEGKWWYYSETWTERYGPYNTKEEAKTALMKYCYGGK